MQNDKLKFKIGKWYIKYRENISKFALGILAIIIYAIILSRIRAIFIENLQEIIGEISLPPIPPNLPFLTVQIFNHPIWLYLVISCIFPFLLVLTWAFWRRRYRRLLLFLFSGLIVLYILLYVFALYSPFILISIFVVMVQMGNYKLIDHTADIGIFIEGKDLKDLFATAAYAMFSQMADLDKVKEKEIKRIELEGENLEDLLIRWLNELLFFTDSGYIFKKFDIEELAKTSLTASVKGEKIDFRKTQLKQQIKAATYHQLEIKKNTSGNWQTTIIFDV